MARKTVNYHFHTGSRKRYGLWNFFWDLVLVLITGGLWLIWIFIREMRRR